MEPTSSRPGSRGRENDQTGRKYLKQLAKLIQDQKAGALRRRTISSNVSAPGPAQPQTFLTRACREDVFDPVE
jgi:hypothetical protein